MTELSILLGFVGVLHHTIMPWSLPRTRYARNGGLRFFRIGRLQLSWCVCRNAI